MTTTHAFIAFIVLAWATQIFFGYLQIRKFNVYYTKLAQKGKYIGVGKSKGRFSPKVLVILAIDAQQKVVDSILMQGITVFAQPSHLSQLHGMYCQEINAKKIFPNQKRQCEALENALSIQE